VNTPYTRHVRLWTWAGWRPLTPTEYRYPLKARAAWLLSGNVEECEWTPECLKAIERIEGYIVAHCMTQAEVAAFELTRQIKPTTETTWKPE
jgi:hypothetical protein